MNEGTENNLEVMQMMKRISVMAMLAAILLLALSTVTLAASPINKDGYYKGIRLAGKAPDS